MFRATGQLTPTLGWRLATPDVDGVQFVLIYGARRRAAALELGRCLLVELLPCEPSREEIVRRMHGENRGRVDYTPLEDAREYRADLDLGIYRTAEEMATALGVSKATVSRTLALLTICPEILNLYVDPTWLTLSTGLKLADACSRDDALRRKFIASAATWIADGGRGNPTAHLLQALKASPPRHALDLKERNGRVVGSFRGSLSTKDQFTINLGNGASEALRQDLARVLEKHFGT
ncbi:MAG: chromosome partitioning protein ParB, partial [Thermomicrobiales bacterium]|nr:chromosome partitioning protein ParB [Thermomicrobiales bacterium]